VSYALSTLCLHSQLIAKALFSMNRLSKESSGSGGDFMARPTRTHQDK